MKNLLSILKLTAAVSIFSSFIYIGLSSDDPDIWWHLKVGEKILAEKSIPRFDEFSFTMPGHEWVDHEWLMDAWFWWMRSHDLWFAVSVIFALAAFLPFLLWIKRANSFLGLSLILAAAALMANFVGLRPQIVTIALFFVLFEIIRQKTESGRNYFWFLPVLFFIWANLHGGFAVGLAFLGVTVAARHAKDFFAFRKINRRDIFGDFFIIFASTAVCVINPYGLGLFREVIRVALSADTAKYISEWQSALNLYVLSSVIIISVFIVFALRRDFRKANPAPLFFGAIFMFLLFLKSVRHGPLFLVSAMPFIVLSAGKLEVAIFFWPREVFKKRAKIAVFLIAACSLLAFGYRIYQNEGLIYPAGAAEFLVSEFNNKKEIRLFNDYGWGGYLIYHSPEIKVFIDGRMPHWSDEAGEGAMKDLVKVYFDKDSNAWRGVFKKWGINTVLIAKDRLRSGIVGKYRKTLLKNFYIRKFYNFIVKEEAIDLKKILLESGWQVRYEDDIAAVLGCKTECYGN